MQLATHPLPRNSWKEITPWVVSTLKSGNESPSKSGMITRFAGAELTPTRARTHTVTSQPRGHIRRDDGGMEAQLTDIPSEKKVAEQVENVQQLCGGRGDGQWENNANTSGR